MLILVAKILWSTTHAPQNTYIGAPQKRFSLLVELDERAWWVGGFIDFQVGGVFGEDAWTV
jgi:hypothetical protein